MKSRLEGLMNRFPFIGDVRGKGLLLAFELVSDRDSMDPLPPSMNAFNRIVDIAYDLGLIIYSRRSRGGETGDHFMICPPLIITPAGVDEIISGLTQALEQFATEVGLDWNSCA